MSFPDIKVIKANQRADDECRLVSSRVQTAMAALAESVEKYSQYSNAQHRMDGELNAMFRDHHIQFSIFRKQMQEREHMTTAQALHRELMEAIDKEEWKELQAAAKRPRPADFDAIEKQMRDEATVEMDKEMTLKRMELGNKLSLQQARNQQLKNEVANMQATVDELTRELASRGDFTRQMAFKQLSKRPRVA